MTYRELIDMLLFYAGSNPERLDCAARVELEEGKFFEVQGFQIDAECPNPQPILRVDSEQI